MSVKLMNCKRCGREISAGASACPHCGEEYISEGKRFLIVLGLILVVAIMLLIFCLEPKF